MGDIKEVRRILQQAALRDFPNPDRVGCPSKDTLNAMARRRRATSEAELHHITHCSPCFATFLEIRRSIRKQHLTYTALGVACAALILCVSLALHVRITRQPIPVIAHWDLENSSLTRGMADQPQARLEVPAKRGKIIVRLPLGSDDGQYDIEIWTAHETRSVIRKARGVAAIHDGHTNLVIQMDLSTVGGGNYFLAFRHADASWHMMPIVIH